MSNLISFLKTRRADEYIFYLCILLLPLNDALLVISFGVFLFFGILLNFKEKDKTPLALIITLLFLVSLVSLSYTYDFDASQRKVFKNLAFLLVPLGFYFNRISPKALNTGKFLFLVSWIIFCLASLLKLLIFWFKYPEQRPYYNFIQASMHHNYMPQDAMYICTALIFLLFSFTHWHKYLRVGISLLFFSVLLLFSVRLGILQFSCIMLIYIIINRKRLINLKNIAVLILVLILGSILITSNNYTKDKIFSTLQSLDINVGKDKTTEIAKDYHQINFRLKLWPIALDLIQERPLFGYGAGTEKGLIYKETQAKGFNLQKVHAHNQFLSMTFQYGLFGLSVFIFMLVSLFLKAISHLEYFLIFFLILTSMITDSYFDVQQGLFYFALFGSLILVHNEKSKEE
ncbi:O-antigen ligase family protein [Mesohalobacter halotolerans]|uniref:O-antigen ligase family protein n=1 Tax=Mesohalobacter halotolerans TaxID=1883405 RepID=A0A4U5TU90_9FLAO|nr:O-antigen ligase family protein [Mesohalobacter halotolerans]TKS57064.1 O-antigen ligase family protein [Mesohalobacter halotolerans]